MRIKVVLLMLAIPLFAFGQINSKQGQQIESRSQETINGQSFEFIRTEFAPVNNRKEVNFFEQSRKIDAKKYQGTMSDGLILPINSTKLETFNKNSVSSFTMQVQVPDQSQSLNLKLESANIFAKGFNAFASSNPSKPIEFERGLHYHGKVIGDDNSMVAISVFKNEVVGLIMTASGNYNLGKLKDSKTDHIIYNDRAVQQDLSLFCATEDDGVEYRPNELEYQNASRDVGDCTQIYIELDQSMTIGHGGTVQAINWSTALFNQSAIIYDGENIDMTISEIFAWDTPDPYSGPSSALYRAQFQNNTGVFNGDLGHLLALDNVGGQAAGFSGICNADTDQSLCFSGMSGLLFNNVPTYSFNVMIFTHELGHLFGSRHTHACVWNGNGTAIDGCAGFTEGACALPGLPATGGTIMSYCASTAVGIDFSQGFGPQPGNVIRNTILNANCLDSSCGCTLDVDCSNITDQTISCRADLPPVDFDNPIIVDSCGSITLSALTIIPGNTGCPGDQIEITRTYFIQDSDGNMAECMQTFTVVSNVPPTITCPADASITCAADIMVSAANATATAECGTAMVSISGPVIVGAPDCSGTTYSYTYTVTDDCNRTASCTQVFTINGGGLSVTCPAPSTVSCAADIMVDPSDVTVNNSCGQGFTTTIVGPNVTNGLPDCDGSIYTYNYLVTDVCGQTAVCQRQFTISNAGPVISCIGNQIAECSDDINVDPAFAITFSTSCGLNPTIDVDGPNLLGFAPTCNGTQYGVNYTVTDACGRSDQCTVIWTLVNSGPEIRVCAPDRIVECQSDIMSEPELLEVELVCGTYQIFPNNITPLDGLGGCSGAQYAIKYDVFDECGRQASCTQIWTLENDPPRVIPPETMEVACLDDVNLSIFSADVETSCGIPIVERELIGPIYDESEPLCAGTVVNYLYSFWDACGRMTCEAQSIIINPSATMDGLFADLQVDCDNIPDLQTSFEACGINYDLEVTETEVDEPGLGDDYRLIRNYTAVDVCGNVFDIDQTIRVRCDGPQTSSREYCAFGKKRWQEMMGDIDNPTYNFSKFTKDDPFIIGSGDKVLEIDNLKCLLQLESFEGSPLVFANGMGEIFLSADKDCKLDNAPEIVESITKNGLLTKMIALALSIQVDSEFAKLALADICIDFDPKVLSQMINDPTVNELYKLGETALVGSYEGDLYSLDEALFEMLNYFEDCPEIPCGNGEEINVNENSKYRIKDASISVFPNPALNYISYQVREVKEEVVIRIYNTYGNVVYEKAVSTSTQENITVEHLPGGLYHLILLDKNRVLDAQKFIKQSE